jgi:hypothetical protein
MSRQASGGDQTSQVSQRDYDMASLARVPSYGAALRTPGHLTPFTEGPPSYVEATSRPPSPGIQRPGQAHVRTGADSPNSQSSDQTLTNNLANSNLTTQPPSALRVRSRSRGGSSATDDEARLRMLRART